MLWDRSTLDLLAFHSGTPADSSLTTLCRELLVIEVEVRRQSVREVEVETWAPFTETYWVVTPFAVTSIN